MRASAHPLWRLELLVALKYSCFDPNEITNDRLMRQGKEAGKTDRDRQIEEKEERERTCHLIYQC